MAAINSNAQISKPKIDTETLKDICTQLLRAIGEDPEREGLRDTPARFARRWKEFIEYEPGNITTSFQVDTSDQMVAVSGINLWSLCEHHLLPFRCSISIGYIAKNRVLGLSKFARIAHKFAHRLQMQERLVSQIADEIQGIIQTDDIAVVGRGEHLCMSMRGVKTEGIMSTSVMRGCFRKVPEVRQEFLQMINYNRC